MPRAQIEKTEIVGLIAQLPVEARPAFRRDLPFEGMPDFRAQASAPNSSATRSSARERSPLLM